MQPSSGAGGHGSATTLAWISNNAVPNACVWLCEVMGPHMLGVACRLDAAVMREPCPTLDLPCCLTLDAKFSTPPCRSADMQRPAELISYPQQVGTVREQHGLCCDMRPWHAMLLGKSMWRRRPMA